jgi:hypothetical protein
MTIRRVKVETLADALKSLEQEFDLHHSISEHPEILESDHFRKKSSELNNEAALSLLELGVPIKKGPEFPLVKFDKWLAKSTKFEQLVRNCFPRDTALYGY